MLINDARRRFAVDPEAAFSYIEDSMDGDRQRRAVPLFEGLLVAVEEVVAIDQPRAKPYAQRCVALAHDMEINSSRTRRSARGAVGLSYGVLARCLVAEGRVKRGLKLLGGGLKLEDSPGYVKASLTCRKAVVLMTVRSWDSALKTSDRGIALYRQNKVSTPSAFNSLSMALLVRASIWGSLHYLGLEDDSALRGIMADSGAALDAMSSGPEKRLLKELQPWLVKNLAYVAASRGFGFDPESGRQDDLARLLKSCPRPKSAVEAARFDWVAGFALGALAPLRSAREVFHRAGLADEAVEVTVDIQVELIRQGRWSEAVNECEFIVQELPAVKFEADVLKGWVFSVQSRCLATEPFQLIRRVRLRERIGQK